MTHSNSLPTTKRSNEQIQQSLLVVYSAQAVIFLFFALGVYLAITTGSWQSYVFIALAIQAEIFGAVDIVFLRRGQTENSGLFILTGNLIAGAVAPYFFVSLGYVGVAYILVNAFFNIRYVLSKKFWRLAIITSGLALLSSLAAELINPAWRQVSSVMLFLSPIFTAILGLAFFIVVIREALTGALRAKLVTAFLAITIIPLAIISIITYNSTRTSLTNDANQTPPLHQRPQRTLTRLSTSAIRFAAFFVAAATFEHALQERFHRFCACSRFRRATYRAYRAIARTYRRIHWNVCLNPVVSDSCPTPHLPDSR